MKLLLSLLLIIFVGCSTPSKKKTSATWTEENQKKIDSYLKFTQELKSPIAIFDWDNTVIINDLGDALMAWMIKHDLIIKPSAWKKSSKWLNQSALNNLEVHCKGSPFKPLQTSKHTECADTIMSIYHDNVAWNNSYNKDTIEPAYAWLASLLANYTHDEIKVIAAQAIEFNLMNPLLETQQIGSKAYPASLRVYPQMKKLIGQLQKNKVDVWIVSASPQAAVEIFAQQVNIAPKNVIGIRNTLTKDQKYTSTFQSCGTYPDGEDIITYRQGKRCWINKIIFKMNKNDQMEKRSPISLAAGDSDTDIFFLKDAQDFHIVINRNKPEIMCHALANLDEKWIINPMFIDPKTKKNEAYSCKRFGLPDQEE